MSCTAASQPPGGGQEDFASFVCRCHPSLWAEPAVLFSWISFAIYPPIWLYVCMCASVILLYGCRASLAGPSENVCVHLWVWCHLCSLCVLFFCRNKHKRRESFFVFSSSVVKVLMWRIRSAAVLDQCSDAEVQYLLCECALEVTSRGWSVCVRAFVTDRERHQGHSPACETAASSWAGEANDLRFSALASKSYEWAPTL